MNKETENKLKVIRVSLYQAKKHIEQVELYINILENEGHIN